MAIPMGSVSFGLFFFCSFFDGFASSPLGADVNEKILLTFGSPEASEPVDQGFLDSELLDHGSLDFRRLFFFPALDAPSDVSASVLSAEVV
jgi:hypothetical protein